MAIFFICFVKLCDCKLYFGFNKASVKQVSTLYHSTSTLKTRFKVQYSIDFDHVNNLLYIWPALGYCSLPTLVKICFFNIFHTKS